MKTSLFLLAFALVAGGCAYRDAQMWHDDTAKALQTKQNDIQACYDGVLKTNPTAAGKVTVTFEVETENATITNVAVDQAATTAPEPVTECVTRNIAGVAVPPPDKRVGQATWTFDFAPQS